MKNGRVRAHRHTHTIQHTILEVHRFPEARPWLSPVVGEGHGGKARNPQLQVQLEKLHVHLFYVFAYCILNVMSLEERGYFKNYEKMLIFPFSFCRGGNWRSERGRHTVQGHAANSGQSQDWNPDRPSPRLVTLFSKRNVKGKLAEASMGKNGSTEWA